VPIGTAEKINIEVVSVVVAAATDAPVVDLRLTNDLAQGLSGLPPGDLRFVLSQLSGAPAGSGESSQWQSYITRDSGGIADAQASTEAATAGTLVDNGDGGYQYTFAQTLNSYSGGPIFDGSRTHRLGIEIRGQAPISSNGVFDFVPAGGAPTFTRNIVDNDTCNACHDVLEFHGGPRTDVPYCVTCHNPSSIDGDSGNTVDMAAMIHNIHSGRDGYTIVGFGGSIHDYSNVEFTQDPRNCQTCHAEDNQDNTEASNWRTVANRASCGTCHFDDGISTNGVHNFSIEIGDHPGGFLFTDDTQCLDCHGEGASVTNSEGELVRTDQVHRIPALEAGMQFVYNLVDVRNVTTGGFLEIDYSVTNQNGVAYNLDTAPEFTACADGTSRLAIDIGWATNDFTNVDNGNNNGAPLSINALGIGCGGSGTDLDGDGVYTVISAVAIPTGITGSIAVAIEGHPGVDLNGDGAISGSNERIAVTNAIQYFGIATSTTIPRRNVVAIEKCNQCHEQLALHGNNRTDKPEVCALCHNPNATDIPVRVAGTACEATLGLDDESIDMKSMIHGIHAGTIGVCGFRSSAHSYIDVVYPGRLNNCEGCHLADSYYPVEPSEILATTVDANDPSTPIDDRVISPNTAVCSSCHTDALAKQHMMQNGGDFNATKAVDSSLISSEVETCVLCHGPGRLSDVKEAHGVGEFNFN